MSKNLNPYIALARPHQWLKNVLIFAPLIFSGKWTFDLAFSSFIAFMAFCFLASAAYCLNDALDAEKDRAHPKKRYRPVASGAISFKMAVSACLLLTALAFLTASKLDPSALLVLIVYICLQASYTIALKQIVILDILLLSVLYVVRVVMGVAATSIAPSTWILTVTWLGALMLASGKRYIETQTRSKEGAETRKVLSEYSRIFLRQLITMTSAMTMVCYLLWCQETVESGRFLPLEIFPTALIVCFGILRYKLLLFHGRFAEDTALGIVRDIPIVSALILFGAFVSVVLYV